MRDMRRLRLHIEPLPPGRPSAAAAVERRLEVADDDPGRLVPRMVRAGRARRPNRRDILMPGNDNDAITALDGANRAVMSAALMIQDSRATLERFLKDVRKLNTARADEIPPVLLDENSQEFIGIIRPVYDEALKFLGTWELAAEQFKVHDAKRKSNA
jgi:hypothetical protein